MKATVPLKDIFAGRRNLVGLEYFGPQRALPTRVWRFYRGGKTIDELAGRCVPDSEYPEDWLGSTTPAAVPEDKYGRPGLSYVELPDGSSARLADLVREFPGRYLGSTKSGALPPGRTDVLVKLLDPAQRLPVHAHPSNAFARDELNAPLGKAEAWIVLGVRPTEEAPCVYIGLNRGVEPDEYARWMRSQDTEALLGSLHRLDVRAGDAFYVPPGVPHAIGPNVLIAEVQQPSDLSLLCEHRGYPVSAAEAYMGLPLERAIAALDLRERSVAEVEASIRIQRKGNAILCGECETYFSAVEVPLDTDIVARSFSVIACVEGDAVVTCGQRRQSCRAGDAFVVPAGSPPWSVSGSGRLLQFQGPGHLAS